MCFCLVNYSPEKPTWLSSHTQPCILFFLVRLFQKQISRLICKFSSACKWAYRIMYEIPRKYLTVEITWLTVSLLVNFLWISPSSADTFSWKWLQKIMMMVVIWCTQTHTTGKDVILLTGEILQHIFFFYKENDYLVLYLAQKDGEACRWNDNQRFSKRRVINVIKQYAYLICDATLQRRIRCATAWLSCTFLTCSQTTTKEVLQLRLLLLLCVCFCQMEIIWTILWWWSSSKKWAIQT